MVTDQASAGGTALGISERCLTTGAAPVALLSAFFAVSLLGNRVPVVGVALVGMLAVCVVGAATGRLSRLPEVIALGVIVVLGSVVSSVLGGIPVSSWVTYDFLRRDGKVAIALLPLLYAAVVRHPPERVAALARLIAGSAACLAVPGVTEYVVRGFNDEFTLGVGLTRRLDDGLLYYHGFHESHNAAAGFYVVAAFLALGQATATRWKRSGWVFAFFICAVVVILTLSRANTAGLVAVLTYLFVRGSQREYRKYAGAVLACAVIVAVPAARQRFSELADYREVANVAIRLEAWGRALGYVDRSPVLGLGFSTFNDQEVHGFAGVEHVWQWKRDPVRVTSDAHAHNFGLHVLAETGLVGLAVWTVFLVAAWRTLKTAERAWANYEPRLAATASGTGLALLALVVASLVDVNLAAPATMMPVYFLVAALALTTRTATKDRTARDPAPLSG